jgi:hypothetical protein
MKKNRAALQQRAPDPRFCRTTALLGLEKAKVVAKRVLEDAFDDPG